MKETIRSNFENYWSHVSSLNEEVLFSLDWDDFAKAVSMLNIKSYGTLIEKRILRCNGWEKVRGHASHGDAVTNNGKIAEVKASFITPMKNSSVTIRGIRPWHQVDEYHFIIIDIRNFKEAPKTFPLLLDKAAIEHEQKVTRTLRPYSEKAADRVGRANVQLGTFLSNDELERWKRDYSSSLLTD